MFRRVRRAALAFVGAGILMTGTLGALTATTAHAYGADNWQTTFAGTGTVPSTGQGFGFWGWCAFGGGVTSGNDGDCQFSQYFHAPSGGGFTCEVSLDISSWTADGDFIMTGTATVNPARLTGPCVSLFPGSTTFSNTDSGIPAKAGHYNFGPLGPVGEFQMQVTQVK